MSRRFVRETCVVAALPLFALLLTACDQSSDLFSAPDEAIGTSVAYGVWEPSPHDTCSKQIHDSYSVIGPDGKLYPTWHPPTDPSGCTFGHEHGRDPRGSDLYGEVGPIPFALANEALDQYDPLGRRHEDHVGHKVEWENNIRLNVGGGAASLLEVECDVMTKLHQGTHSRDAFTNNLHEVVYHIRCSDGAGFSATFLAAIGKAGELVASCDRGRRIDVGTPTPANSPSGGGKRAIPDRQCIEQHILRSGDQNSNFNSGLRESWEISGRIRTNEGRTIASFNPYYQVLFPSRFFDPAMPGLVGRPIDVCYEVTAEGRRANGSMCEQSTGDGQILGVEYDNPQSRFNGVERFVDINANRVSNLDGPEIWYSDPFGMNASTEPFPGSIKQWVARADNSAFDTHGPVIGKSRSKTYGDASVHAPN